MTVAIIVFWMAWAWIAAPYLLFPLLLAWRARRSPLPPPQTDMEPSAGAWPRVAMVVAAYNEEAVLAEKLANTWAIAYPSDRFELWIGSDGCSDNTNAILRACADARLHVHLFSERRGKISVLNDLVAEIEADILIMSDANTLYAPDAVQRLVAHFADRQVGCVSGELSLTQEGGVSGEGLYWKYEGWIKRNESRLGFLIGCNGGIFALRRELYEPLPPSTIVEDFVLTLRILERGFLVRFEPEARASEPACSSASAEMVRKVRIGAGGFQAIGLTRALLHPRYGLRAFAYWGHKILRWLVPFFFLAGLSANLFLARLPLYAFLLACQGAGACISLWAYRARPGQEPPSWTRPVSYFYLMNFALCCGFFRFLFGTQRVTWEQAAPRLEAHPAPRSLNKPESL